MLHPYQMVKDLRSGYETGNTSAVLDGDLDAFMQAELERLATGGEAAATRAAATTPRDRPDRAAPDRAAIRFRDATEDDIPVCAEVWRASINDYIVRLNQPEVPDDLSIIQRHYRHVRSTDPERFVVATQDDAEPRPANASLASRSPTARHVWFLSMLFVLPDVQAQGWAATCSAACCRPTERMARATATDSAQPISNALYALHGIVPRTPLLSLIGQRPATGGVRRAPERRYAVAFEEIVARRTATTSPARRTVDALDREPGLRASARSPLPAEQDRRGWLYLGPDGTHSVTATAAPAGGSDRSSFATRRCSIRAGPPRSRRWSRAGRSSRGSPGRRIGAGGPRAASGLRLEPFAAPVLGPPADRLRALPADLARHPVGLGVAWRGSPWGGSLTTDVAPSRTLGRSTPAPRPSCKGRPRRPRSRM